MADRRALIVDDSKSARFALRRSLESHQFQVESVESVSEAMVSLRNRIPSVIFLDQVMPDAEGLQVLRDLRKRPGTANVPVIICSSDEGPEFNALAREADADGVVSKPPDPRQLKDIVRLLEADELRPMPTGATRQQMETAAPSYQEMTLVPEPEMHVYRLPGTTTMIRPTVTDVGSPGEAGIKTPTVRLPPQNEPDIVDDVTQLRASPVAKSVAATAAAAAASKSAETREKGSVAAQQEKRVAAASPEKSSPTALNQAAATPDKAPESLKDASVLADGLSSLRLDLQKSIDRGSDATTTAMEERLSRLEAEFDGRLKRIEASLETLQTSVGALGAAAAGSQSSAEEVEKTVTSVLASLSEKLAQSLR